MWWNKRDEEGGEDYEDGASMESYEDHQPQLHHQQHRTSSVPSKKSRAGETNRQTFLGSKSLSTRTRQHRKKSKSNASTGHMDKPPKHGGHHNKGVGDSNSHGDVAETNMGFEVSLEHLVPGNSSSHNNKAAPAASAAGGGASQTSSNQQRGQLKAVISFQGELQTRQKINRTQYSVSQWPALEAANKAKTEAQNNKNKRILGLPNNKNHRVVMQPDDIKTHPHHAKSSSSEMSAFDDALFLLRSHEVVDETTSVKQEIAHLKVELDALYADRTKLEQMSKQQEQKSKQEASRPSPTSSTENLANLPKAWDTNELLASKPVANNANPATTATSTTDENRSSTAANSTDASSISAEQRIQLQNLRGTTLTVFFHDKTATEALASKCGVKHHVLARFKESSRNSVLELSMDTCQKGGAATHISNLSILGKSGGRAQRDFKLGFFIGRDKGNALHWGHLPDRLFRRMQDSGRNPRQSASELTFLAVGPMDYYYAEFRSGEAWWGSSTEDRAFQAICSEWDVHRVVFGPSLAMDDFDADLHSQTVPWIIVSRDGRAAWKNIPARLDHLLSSRMANQAGIAEVSLGSGDAYFCRFLDGTTDYCLPAQQAAIAHELEARGLTITNIVLHPELSNGFVIRSTYV